MVTGKVSVDNGNACRESVLGLADSFCESVGIGEKDKLRLILLAEEMLSMTATISGDFSAEFWLDGDSAGYRLHLSAKMKMTVQKREELLKTSTSGKNSAYTGMMDRIKEEMEIYWLSLEENAEDSTGVDYGVETLLGFSDRDYSTPEDWKLSEFKGDMARRNDSERIAAWDELEKSIVANIADEVTVGIRNNQVELIIFKSL